MSDHFLQPFHVRREFFLVYMLARSSFENETNISSRAFLMKTVDAIFRNLKPESERESREISQRQKNKKKSAKIDPRGSLVYLKNGTSRTAVRNEQYALLL